MAMRNMHAQTRVGSDRPAASSSQGLRTCAKPWQLSRQLPAAGGSMPAGLESRPLKFMEIWAFLGLSTISDIGSELMVRRGLRQRSILTSNSSSVSLTARARTIG